MHITTRAEDSGVVADTLEEFSRETYICGPSVVLGHGENEVYIFMSPTFEGSRDIQEVWKRDLKDTQIIVEPIKAANENFTKIRPGIDMIPETYRYLCLDIVAFDKKEFSKLYATDYYIYK